MSHHGREYEDEPVRVVYDTPEQSLEKALKLMGASSLRSQQIYSVSCEVDGKPLTASAPKYLDALTTLLAVVAAAPKKR